MDTDSVEPGEAPGEPAATLEIRICPTCGTKFSATGDSGLCPVCILLGAIGDESASNVVLDPVSGSGHGSADTDALSIVRRFENYEVMLDADGNPIGASSMKVKDKEPTDQPWIEKILSVRWGGLQVIAHGEIFDAHLLPALVAGDREGLATFRIQQTSEAKFAELVTLDAVTTGQGVGTALIDALIARLRGEKVAVLRVTTTNDNLNALRFYQRRGFRITGVRPGAIDKSRFLKPSIPLIGEYGIPVRDEIELERQVQS